MKTLLQLLFAMNHTKLFLIFAFLFHLSCSLINGSEFTVTLPTKTNLHAVYISAFLPQKTTLSKEYLSQLRDILTFDLKVSGEIFPSSQSAQAEKTLQSPDPFPLSFWGNREVSYIVHLKATSKSIFATLFFGKHRKILSN